MLWDKVKIEGFIACPEANSIPTIPKGNPAFRKTRKLLYVNIVFVFLTWGIPS